MSLLAVGIADQAAARHRAKSSSAATVKSDKLATSGEKASSEKASGGKKTAKGKSKDDKSAPKSSGVPQIRLRPGPEPEVSAADVALVKSSLDALRSGGASKATGIAASISDPAARKLVEWLILRGDHNGVDSKRYLAFIAANPGWPSLAISAAAPRPCSGSRTSSRRRR